MNPRFLLTSLFCVLLLASCSDDEPETVEISTDNTRIDGPAADYFSFVPGEYELSIGSDIMEDWTISIELAREGESRPDDETLELKVMVVDEKGRPISDFPPLHASESDVAALLDGAAGTRSWVRFTASAMLGSQYEGFVPPDATSFILSSGYAVKEIETAAVSTPTPEAGTYSYSGVIGENLAVEMNLHIDEFGDTEGKYWYTKKKYPIDLRGTVQNGIVSLEEDSEGARTGIFSGTYQSPNLLTGTWSAPDGSRTLPFTLTGTVGNTAIAIGEEEMYSTASYSSSGGYTIDEYLDDYEQYLLQIVDVMKKAKANDPSAMQEYFEVLEDAQDISEKLDGMEDEMEPRHLDRLMKLNQRLVTSSQGL